jgi:predicted RecA/RadA family phage recombinase
MAEAILSKDADTIDVVTPSAGYSSGEVIQLPDGRAAVVQGLTARVENDPAALKTSGQVTLAKTASVVILDGDPIYWDRSANTATPLRAVAGADFPIGVAVGDAASADATVVVDLNVKPVYVVDLLRDPTDSVTVLTAATNVVNSVVPGGIRMALGTTHAEANKVDHLSQRSVPVTIPFIVEGRMAVYDIGDEASVDINVGLANATHASDCDSITESCLLHLDGTALDILAESDDGTTEVAATNTTVDAVDDTWFDFRMDCRDLADIQIYINGVNVLPASVFKLDAATGPLKLLAHVEKGANDTPGEIRIAHLAIRAMDVVR